MTDAFNQENKYLIVLKYQIKIFKNIFSSEDDGEKGLTEYPEKQEFVFDSLFYFHYGPEADIKEFCLDEFKGHWLNICKRIFLDAKARFRAIHLKDLLKDKDQGLKIGVDIKAADVGATRPGFSNPSSLTDWVKSKGQGPTKVTSEQLLAMLKEESEVFSSTVRAL